MSVLLPSNGSAQTVSDTDVRAMMIRDSIAFYPGKCPCPYNRMSNGRRCGKRSAYIRPGGYAPLCFPEDIPDAAVRRYRQQQKLDK